jgi:hypothetical protein
MAGPHHRGADYERRAADVRARANANPATTCWRCGKTKAQHGQPWEAGHITDGKIGGELRAECRRCNRKAGGRRSVELRKKRRQPTNTTRRW